MIKPKQLKLKSPNSAQGLSITIPHPPMNIRSRLELGLGLGLRLGDSVADMSYAPLPSAPLVLLALH